MVFTKRNSNDSFLIFFQIVIDFSLLFSKSKNLTKGEEAALKNFDRYRKAGLGAEEAAQRALVRGGGYSVKTAKEYRNLTRTVEGVGERAVERIAGRAAATGTGKALKMGANCDVDILFVHAPASEKKFLKSER